LDWLPDTDDSPGVRLNVPSCSDLLIQKLMPDYSYASLLGDILYDVFAFEKTKHPRYGFTVGAKLYHQDWTDLTFSNFNDGEADLTTDLDTAFSNYLEIVSQDLVEAAALGSSHIILSYRVWSVFYRIDWERVKRLGSTKGKLPVELYGQMEKKTAKRFPVIPRFDSKNFEDELLNENAQFFQITCQHFVIRNDDRDFLKCLLGHIYDGYCMSKDKTLKQFQDLFMTYIRTDREVGEEVPAKQAL
jgi:hypothetical protein